MASLHVVWMLIQLFFDSGLVMVAAFGIILPPPLLGHRRTRVNAKTLSSSKEIPLLRCLAENLPD